MQADYREGTQTSTPIFYDDHHQPLSWCGKDVTELSEYDGWAMRRFIEQEAYFYGYACGLQQPVWNPFDSGMLFGEPAKLWGHYYGCGVQDRRNGVEARPTLKQHATAGDFQLWSAILSNLDELARDFETSYKKIGIRKKSSLRGLLQGICGWLNQSDSEFVPVFDEQGWRYI